MKTQHMNPDEAAFYESRLHYTRNAQGESVNALTDEHDSAELFIYLENILDSLIQSNESLFAVKINSRNQQKFIHATDLGKMLLGRSTALRKMERNLARHIFTPTVAAFIQHANLLSINTQWEALKTTPNHDVQTTVDKLNAFVEALRSELQTDEHRTAVAKFKRSAKDNCDALIVHFKSWFEKHAKVLVLRFDLGYGEDVQRSFAGSPEKFYGLMAQQVQAHRDLFFKYVRKLFKGEKPGYAWKLEYGLFKGFHCHVVLLLNGDKHRADVNLVRQLGEYWRNEITEGKGVYFNCNAQKHLYKYCALGLLHACDEDKWKGLEYIARYLTKPDGYIKLELPNHRRVFGKSNKPAVPQVKLGRPRSKQTAQERLQVGSIRARYPVSASQFSSPVC